VTTTFDKNSVLKTLKIPDEIKVTRPMKFDDNALRCSALEPTK